MLERIRLAKTELIDGDRGISIPLNLQFNPMDNSELVENWASSEAKKTINDDIDRETIRYFGELNLNFNFYDSETETYTTDYEKIGFNSDDITKKSTRFKTSFYRLYFYDSTDEQTRTLLLTEDLNPLNTNTYPELSTSFTLKRLFWLKNDEVINESGERDVYLTTSFFNRATGDVKSFLNSPNRTSPYTISEYSSNLGWRTHKVTIKKSGDVYSFESLPNVINLFETIVK